MSANFLAGTVFLAFLVFITTRGELKTYIGYMGIGKGAV